MNPVDRRYSFDIGPAARARESFVKALLEAMDCENGEVTTQAAWHHGVSGG